MTARIVSILKRKGGAGSSTLAANVGAEWHSRGLRVCVLDVDPQRSLQVWSELGEGGALQEIVETSIARPGSEFAALLEQRGGEVDRLIVDCGPGFDPLALQSATLADCIVIPCRPSPLDLDASIHALEVAELGARGREGVSIAFAPMAGLPRTRLGAELPEQLEALAKKAQGRGVVASVLPAVNSRIIVAESVLSGQAVRELDPESPATHEFALLTDAIERLLL